MKSILGCMLSLLIQSLPILPLFAQSVLSPGGCRNEAGDHCASQVRDSVCNVQRNECFCRKGFVAIREDDEVVCRTLLTDLSCRVDADCVHVDASVCHPGAGKCVCPGEFVYVAQLHACRLRARTEEIMCHVCQSIHHGECFHLYPNDPWPWAKRVGRETRPNVKSGVKEMSETRKRSRKFGCACKPPKATVDLSSTQQKFRGLTAEETMAEQMCQGHLIDIGEQCNQVDQVCRAHMAVCVRTGQVPEDQDRISASMRCVCPENFVPVFQSNLGYHECFHQIKHENFEKEQNSHASRGECEACQSVAGRCYDLNEDGVGDGCICPAHLSHMPNPSAVSTGPRRTFEQTQSTLIDPCRKKHVYTYCSKNELVVCYLPHDQSSTISGSVLKQIQQGHCSVRLGPSARYAPDAPNQCGMTLSRPNIIETTTSQSPWIQPMLHCSQMTVRNGHKLPCGVQVIASTPCVQNTNYRTVTYSGTITLGGETTSCRVPPLNREMTFTCQMQDECIHKSREVEAPNVPPSPTSLSLHVLNEHNQSMQTVFKGESIRLSIRSTHNTDVYLKVNLCVISPRRGPTEASKNITFIMKTDGSLWHNRCKNRRRYTPILPQTIGGITTVPLNQSIWPSRLLRTSNLKSSTFPAPPSGSEGYKGMRISCHVTKCTDKSCPTVDFDAMLCRQSAFDLSKLKMPDSQLLSADISIEHAVKAAQVACRLISCFSMIHLLLGCIILLVLDMTIFGLLLWSYRRGYFHRKCSQSLSTPCLPDTDLQPTTDSTIDSNVPETMIRDTYARLSAIQPLVPATEQHSTAAIGQWVHNHLHQSIYSNSPPIESVEHRTHGGPSELPIQPCTGCVIAELPANYQILEDTETCLYPTCHKVYHFQELV